MWKQLSFTLLRIAAGFLTVTFLFMLAPVPGYLPADNIDLGETRIYDGFYLGTLGAWIVGTVLALGVFAGVLKEDWGKVLRWAPIFTPILYAVAAYVWLSRDALLG